MTLLTIFDTLGLMKNNPYYSELSGTTDEELTEAEAKDLGIDLQNIEDINNEG